MGAGYGSGYRGGSGIGVARTPGRPGPQGSSSSAGSRRSAPAASAAREYCLPSRQPSPASAGLLRRSANTSFSFIRPPLLLLTRPTRFPILKP